MSTKTRARNIKAGETLLIAGGPHKVLRSSKRGDTQVLVISTATGLATWELQRDREVERLGFAARSPARKR